MSIESSLQEERDFLVSRIRECEEKLRFLPEGDLLISSDRGNIRWRRVIFERDGSGKKMRRIMKDIPKSEEPLAAALAEAVILRQLASDCTREVKTLDKFLSKYNKKIPGTLGRAHSEEYYKLAKTRQPLALQDYQKQLEDEYKSSTHMLFAKKVHSDPNVNVRSKSESFIANALHEREFPFVYEPVIFVEGEDGRIEQLAPDFIFIDTRTGKKWMWQHFGRMDDPAYARKNLLNLWKLHQAGWILGVNLIVTSGTLDRPFTQTDARACLKYYAPAI